eukprot:CAMPEP_0195565112 /NCGR_PEP_ID=MMETSP0814-20130614/247_1 /TAXON_ID=97485 /ORGANISM="Prymnesium parvum, Strain Texoma1" /LENGTH=227 /DNA_ID=CAMNT_0040700065 /DNA_START=187 /DNA_END=867 /DNA_ORIENTATION=-
MGTNSPSKHDTEKAPMGKLPGLVIPLAFPTSSRPSARSSSTAAVWSRQGFPALRQAAPLLARRCLGCAFHRESRGELVHPELDAARDLPRDVVLLVERPRLLHALLQRRCQMVFLIEFLRLADPRHHRASRRLRRVADGVLARGGVRGGAGASDPEDHRAACDAHHRAARQGGAADHCLRILGGASRRWHGGGGARIEEGEGGRRERLGFLVRRRRRRGGGGGGRVS